MQVTVERTGPCEAKVSFTVPQSEFAGELRRTLQAYGRNVRMKGFRPGKVPPQVLEKQFGQEARMRTLEAFFNRAMEQAVRDEKLETVGHERVKLEDIEVPEEGDFSHSIEVSLRPEIELVEFEGLKIESELEPVLDAEIEAALEDLKRQRATPEPAGEEGLDEEGMAVCDLAWIKDGETIFERKGLRLSPLDQLPGIEPEAWKEAVLGKKKGDVLELATVVPEEFDQEEHRGAQVTTRLELQEAFRMVPPTDEEIRKLLELGEEDDLQQNVRERIAQAKETRERGRIEAALLDQVLAAQEMQVPSRMVEAQVQGRTHARKHELESEGLSEEEVTAELERQAEEIRVAVERGVKAYFLIQAIAQKAEIQLKNEDLVAELQAIARRNDASFEEVRDYYREKGLIEQIAVELLERKVRTHLREKAEIVQPS